MTVPVTVIVSQWQYMSAASLVVVVSDWLTDKICRHDACYLTSKYIYVLKD